MAQEKYWLMRLLSKWLLCLLVVPAGVFASPPLEPAQRLADMLGNIESLYARYEQQSSSPMTQTGEFWLKKPGYFRVDSGPPLSQTVISDNQSLWTYDRDLEQVIISDLESNGAEIPLLLFAGDPAEIALRYDVEFFEDELRQHFVLRPKDNTSLVQALALSFESNRPASILVETSTQERTTIRLLDQSELSEDDQSLFEFTPPDYVDVIDDRVSAASVPAPVPAPADTPVNNVTVP